MRSRFNKPHTHVTHGKRHSSHRKRLVFSAKRIVVVTVTVAVILVYCTLVLAWYRFGEGTTPRVAENSPDRLLRKQHDQSPIFAANKLPDHDVRQKASKKEDNVPPPVKVSPPKEQDEETPINPWDYHGWRALAVKLASLPANEALDALEQLDPFGTRQFEASLLFEETRLKRLLTLDEIKQLFACPSDRISHPDQRDDNKAQAFRRGDKGTFLFFQHLRKAGGTHFCSMAKANLPKSAVSKYYCMPDMGWSGGKTAGYLHHYSNQDIVRRMTESGHRVAGNEWDHFDAKNHFDLPAVFATSFRRPLDRALSQFRFECIEERGCKIKDIGKWWEKRKDLYNVFVCTFSDGPCLWRVYHGTDEKYAKMRGELMGAAMDTVAKFNLVLVMEWLSYAGPQVQNILGFKDTSVLAKRVRPHIGQAKRNDGQEENKLGAAGIAKASWVPEEYLTTEQYKKMSESLALDEILTEAARRMFLERLVCSDA